MADIIELLPTLPVGLFQADRDGRVRAANAAFGALVQVSVGSPVGAPPWANAHPGDRASAELQWRRCIEAGDDIRLEFRVWHGEGRMTWVRIDAQAMHDSQGMITGYGGTALDHTESVGQQLLLFGVLEVHGQSIRFRGRGPPWR